MQRELEAGRLKVLTTRSLPKNLEMGLCKCKTVTNLFCFQHKKNVCEKCIATDHQVCTVKSYLQWLQDSDYDPNCQICRKALVSASEQESLLEQEVVRLTCLCVYHVSCLDTMCTEMPENTSRAGYACPICNVAIMPGTSDVSRIAQGVRHVFAKSYWVARLNAMFPGKQQEQEAPAVESSSITSTPNASRPSLLIGKSMPNSTVSLGSPVHALKPMVSDVSISIPPSTPSISRVNMGFEDPDVQKYERRINPLVTGTGTVSVVLRRLLATGGQIKRRLNLNKRITGLIFAILFLVIILLTGTFSRVPPVNKKL